jgi:hypothetical protein
VLPVPVGGHADRPVVAVVRGLAGAPLDISVLKIRNRMRTPSDVCYNNIS